MKKIITLAFILIATTQFAFAQQAIAKIKYEEAEEAYTANNFELTVTKLNEVETILKSTNPRVMYLKIMAQNAIINKNPYKDFEILKSTRFLINKYLKDYETLPDNEDKYRDIYKVSEALKKLPDHTAKAFSQKLAYIDSIARLGNAYLHGDLPIDYKKAYLYLKEAADYGNPIGQCGLGEMYFDGLGGLENDTKKGIALLKSAALQGDLDAKICLYVANEDPTKTISKSESDEKLKIILEVQGLIQNGEIPRNAINKVNAANYFRSSKKELELLNLASEQKDPVALELIGNYYEDIILKTHSDYAKALYYYKLAYEYRKQSIEKIISQKPLYNYELIFKDKPLSTYNPYEISEQIVLDIMRIYSGGGYGVKKNKAEGKKWEKIWLERTY